jgi:hypothetical protein
VLRRQGLVLGRGDARVAKRALDLRAVDAQLIMVDRPLINEVEALRDGCFSFVLQPGCDPHQVDLPVAGLVPSEHHPVALPRHVTGNLSPPAHSAASLADQLEGEIKDHLEGFHCQASDVPHDDGARHGVEGEYRGRRRLHHMRSVTKATCEAAVIANFDGNAGRRNRVPADRDRSGEVGDGISSSFPRPKATSIERAGHPTGRSCPIAGDDDRDGLIGRLRVHCRRAHVWIADPAVGHGPIVPPVDE